MVLRLVGDSGLRGEARVSDRKAGGDLLPEDDTRMPALKKGDWAEARFAPG
jgi:hypothetical protein